MYEQGLETFMEQISKFPLLTPTEEKELSLRIADGDESARNRLVEHNLRWGVELAIRQYQREYDHSNFPLADLIQVATLGLIRAADKYDYRQARFTTYATHWIRQFLQRERHNFRHHIRLPVNRGEQLDRIFRAERELEAQGIHNPDPEVVAIQAKLSVDEVELLTERFLSPTSFNKILDPYNDDPKEVMSLHADESGERELESIIDQDFVEQQLSVLSDRERRIIEARFGLNETPEMTLAELGEELGATRERIRQIEASALEKMAEFAT